MSKIILIRHGQASFGKKDYDQLSELGIKQATWLGAYLKECEIKPTRLITGSLTRHKQTADHICTRLNIQSSREEHIGWNEFDFQAIVYAYLKLHPESAPKSNQPKAFFNLLKKSMTAWSRNELKNTLPESWIEFESRVKKAMLYSKSENDNGPVIVVSSGGAISMALKHILRLDNDAMIDLNLQTRNTGISEIYFSTSHEQVCFFNATPHLETKERRASITYA